MKIFSILISLLISLSSFGQSPAEGVSSIARLGGGASIAGTNIFITTNADGSFKFDVPASGSATNLTPWTTDINGAGKALTNAVMPLSNITNAGTMAAVGTNQFLNTNTFITVAATTGQGATYDIGTSGTLSSGIIEAWGTGGKTVYLMPGTYNITTNALVMPPNTILRGLGKVIILQTNGVNRGPLLELNTNSIVDGITITNTISSSATACIGVGTNSPGCSNAIVQNCIFYGNSNAVYFPSAGAASQVHLLNCQINGNVDIHPGQITTAVSVANARSNEVNLINCVVNGSVIVSTGYSNRLMTVGGTINQVGLYYGLELFWNQSYINGTLIHGGTNADIHVHSARLHLNNTSIPGSRLFTSAYSAISQQGLPTLAINETSQNSLSAGDMFTFSDSGQQLFSLANNCFELFDGLQWRPISPALDTNRVVVTGAPDTTFNGVYTYRTNMIGATYGLDFTNLNTKHFLYSPDLYTNQVGSAQDSPVALSANASLIDGNEYDTVDFFWGVWHGNPTIHVEFVQTNGISIKGQANTVTSTNTGAMKTASLQITTPGSAASVVNLALDANFNVVTNASPVGGSSGNQTPWAQNIAGAGFSLSGVDTIGETNFTGELMTLGRINSRFSGDLILMATNGYFGELGFNFDGHNTGPNRPTQMGFSLYVTNVNSANAGVVAFSAGDKRFFVETPLVVSNTAFANSGASNVVTFRGTAMDTIVQADGSSLVQQQHYTTNSGSGVAPDFSKGYTLLSTNAAFTVIAPINVDSGKTLAQTTVFAVTNSTAAAVVITPPANVHIVGTWYVTNVTEITFHQYGNKFTNAVALPIW